MQISTAAYGPVTGRISSIAADPSDPTGNTVYLGTTGGGVWKSTNAAGAGANVSFAPLTDDLPAFNEGELASLTIGAITVQPGGTGVVLAGTGDPNDALDSYYGAGILRSADNGLTWTLIANSNDLSINSLTNFYFAGNAFAGFAWSTVTLNFVVAAVSESAQGLLVGATNIHSEAGTPRSTMGLYYSTDAGQTWLLATVQDGPAQVVQSSFVPVGAGNPATAVVWNPIRKRFYAAIRFHGYYESLDGITFNRLANQPGTALTRTECPTNPNGVGSEACPIFRGALAVQPQSGDMFALTVDVNLLDQGLWQDICAMSAGACASATVAFSQQLPSTALEDGQGYIPLGDYDLTLAAVPVSGDTLLFAGAQDIYRCSLAPGCVFRNTTNASTCAAAQVAPFQHAIDATFAASLSLMYFGNDSGLWRSADNVNQTQPPCGSDDAAHFQNLNGGTGSIAEIVDLAQDPNNSAILLAGLGVNGTAASTATAQVLWPQVLDGNGSYVAIDPANPMNWYAQSSLGVAIDLCPNGPACDPAAFGTPAIGFAQVGADAYASFTGSPFILDPQNSGNLILGTCHVWLGPADGNSWTPSNELGELYPGEGPDCGGNELVQSLAASGTVVTPMGNVELLYAGMEGLGFDGPQANAGHLYQAIVGNSALTAAGWIDISQSPAANDLNGFNPADFSVSSVTVDTHDVSGQTVYATVQGFDTILASTGSVYASTNAGASWLNITSNLPGVPANSMAVDPNDANTVYVAVDTGVYVTTAVTTCAIQNCWSLYGTGLPNSPVVQLAAFNVGEESLLRAGTYGRGIWQVPLITAAAALSSASETPASLTFAPQQAQTQSTPQSVTVINTGTIPLVVSQTAATGGFTAANSCGEPTPVGGNCAVAVTFTPTATGPRTGTLTIYANIPGGQLTVPLSGTGLAASSIVLLPTSMSFGSSPIGVSTAPAQNMTISNTGGVTATLQVPTTTGDFAIVANTCGTTLQPNFGCTVSLAFTPTASGQRTGIFTIADSVGTQTATLSGIGLSAATDTLIPIALSFAKQTVGTTSAAQTITLSNSGDSPLNSIGVTSSGDFHVVNGCGETLIGHASCALTVTYVPTEVGVETGSVVVNDMYGHPHTIILSGIGSAPPGVVSALPTALDFGSYGIGGTTAAQALVVTNSGTTPLKGLSFSISGSFAILSNSCPPGATPLAVAASCAAQVAFSPTQPGNLVGNIAINSSSLAQPFQISLSGNGLGFTFQAQGPSSSTVTSGMTTNPPYSLLITPAAGSTGTLALACSAAPPNSTCTVNPLSLQLHSDGTTSSVSVTIATALASASRRNRQSESMVFALGALLLPIGLLAIPRNRKRVFSLLLLVAIAAVPLGCGVTSSAAKSSPTGPANPVTTPPATYNPVITATGPGVSETVQLTLVVE